MDKVVKVTVWNEYRHEKKDADIAKLYPEGMHGAIAKYLKEQPGLEVRTATLDEPEHGLPQKVLENTDVLTWWGHVAHDEVKDEVVERVHQQVMEGMGLLVLHSGHYAKIFRKLMGTGCELKWREVAEKERLWVVQPGHPIVEGIGEYIELEHTEMYGEHFNIPQPDNLVLVSWFPGGEIFRSGCCFYRGKGKIFYFRPGHETYPIYYQKDVLRVIYNAVRWAAKRGTPSIVRGNFQPLETIA